MTRKITDEELKKLRAVRIGKKHPLRAQIEMMGIGENLQVPPEDFKWKGQTPKRFCNAITKTTGKKFEVLKLLDKKGWVVIRVE